MLIKTYKGKHLHQPHFFILNKGNNSGKPLKTACANCFVCLCNTDEEKSFYYWLCFALWQSGQFEPYLVGSLINFIHIRNVKKVVFESAIKVNVNLKKYHKMLDLLVDVNKREEQLQSQLRIISQAKKALFKDVLK